MFKKYKDLLNTAGFMPFLCTQFLGAFNDNFFKIVISMVAVNAATAGPGGSGWYVSMVGAVFILPFFLFSGYAGYLADVYNKRTVLIVTKSLEIVAAFTGLFALWSGRIDYMLVTLFLMAMHSTFFGPAKYGIVPEILPGKDLSRANGFLEMSTFIAIILGTAIGTIIFSIWKTRLVTIGFLLVFIAATGTLSSLGISRVATSGSKKKFSFNPLGEITEGIKRLLEVKILMITTAAITYFWFLGALLQMDLLLLGKEVMHLSDMRVGILITFLAVGIGIGSIVAGRLSGDKIELGLVPLGSLGMGVLSVALALATHSYAAVCVVLIIMGFFGGFFIVPLNALLQKRSGLQEKGRIIATSNFLSTGGILLSSIVLWAARDLLHIPADRIILIFGIVTILCTLYLIKTMPAFFVRFVLWLLTHSVYRIKIVGEANIPQKGGALLVSNHVSYLDGLFIGSCVHRFVRYMVYQDFFRLKSVNWLLTVMNAIPVADGNRREVIKSIKDGREELINGHVVCIFAEGSITRTGNLQPFKKGFERLAEGLDVPIIPVHLDGVWGSIFSFKHGRFFWKRPKALAQQITVSFGAPLKSSATAHDVRQAVMGLAAEAAHHRRTNDDMLHLRFIKEARKRGAGLCMADSTGKRLSWRRALAASLLLAGWMRKKCGGEKITGLMLPSTAAAALANVAALMAGKTVVNLNFTAGADAINSATTQCRIKTIITSRAFLTKTAIAERPGMVMLEDAISETGAVKKALVFASTFLPYRIIKRIYCRGKSNPSELAAVIFTSGSSGEPKGVMLTHHNVLSNIEGFAQVFHAGKGDAILGVLPFFHSFGYTGTLWFPLLTGVSAVYHTNPLDADTVGKMAREYGATILIATPTFYSAYIKKCRREDFATVRLAVAGAEKLMAQTASAFKEKFGIDMLEGYGCTELSPVISVNTPNVKDKLISQKGRVEGTVGHPIPGVTVKVVNPETLEGLGHGDEGLLMVRGASLMHGYWGNPAGTERSIVDGWYSTGDIASVGEDGFIRIVDRQSRFSKIAGEMIPHIKIEDVLSRLLDCKCAVTGVPDEQKGERLLAFYTINVSPSEVRDKLLATELPRLWIPKKENLHRINEIPLTAAGKTDIKKIRLMAMAAVKGATEQAAQ